MFNKWGMEWKIKILENEKGEGGYQTYPSLRKITLPISGGFEDHENERGPADHCKQSP